MNQLDYIVHRANTLTTETDPFRQVERYVQAGFTRIEVDLYVVSADAYKFCHPVGAETVEQTLHLGDQTLRDFIGRQHGVQWLVDIKYLDVPTLPVQLVEDILSAFDPERDIVTASQKELLELAHKIGYTTCRYRQDEQELSYPLEYYSMDEGGESPLPIDKTFVYCPDPKTAVEKVGYAGVVVDGKHLL